MIAIDVISISFPCASKELEIRKSLIFLFHHWNWNGMRLDKLYQGWLGWIDYLGSFNASFFFRITLRSSEEAVASNHCKTISSLLSSLHKLVTIWTIIDDLIGGDMSLFEHINYIWTSIRICDKSQRTTAMMIKNYQSTKKRSYSLWFISKSLFI